MEPREMIGFEEIVSFTEAAVSAGISRVRVTGGEPLVRAGLRGADREAGGDARRAAICR